MVSFSSDGESALVEVVEKMRNRDTLGSIRGWCETDVDCQFGDALADVVLIEDTRMKSPASFFEAKRRSPITTCLLLAIAYRCEDGQGRPTVRKWYPLHEPGSCSGYRKCVAGSRRLASDADLRRRQRGDWWYEIASLPVFADDVLQCPCGGRRSLLAVVTDPAIARTQRVLRRRSSSTGTRFVAPTVAGSDGCARCVAPCLAGLHFTAALQAIVSSTSRIAPVARPENGA